MTDYLLVHGAGQGAWSWGKVWGYMTAPVEHPPRLYAYRPADKEFSLDLPGHGADAQGDTAAVLMEECVQSILRAVERQGREHHPLPDREPSEPTARVVSTGPRTNAHGTSAGSPRPD